MPARISSSLIAPFVVITLAHAASDGGQDAAKPTEPAATVETAPQDSTKKEEEPKAVEKSAWSVQINLDWTSAYYYHGIVQEDTGFILQPALRLNLNLYEEDDFKIDAIFGSWNSFQSAKTNASTSGDFIDYWYESDIIGGFTITKGKVSFTGTYTALTSPSDAYQTVQELDFTVALDDSEWLGAWALHPYVLAGFEVGADGSDGANTKPGGYLEVGIAPGFSFDLGTTPIAISFPMSAGFSLYDYYEVNGSSDTFGFFQVGGKAAIPLPFGERYGKWTLNVACYGLFLGDNTAIYNGGGHDQVIGTAGIQISF